MCHFIFCICFSCPYYILLIGNTGDDDVKIEVLV